MLRCFILSLCINWSGLLRAEEKISYNQHIRPILSQKCFACHGFDAKKREADLRLDIFDGATDATRTPRAIVPGDATASEMIKRMRSDDPDEIMPPPDAVHRMEKSEIDLIARWIDAGAIYEKHWSFEKPVRPSVPQGSHDSWVKNPIDSFIAAGWKKDRLQPSPEVDRATLLRRLSFDLTGLPPSDAEMKEFLQDTAPDAYEKVVDRLLQMPHYGERMALSWLDAARYADSNGFQQDGDTHQYVWRDWLIRSLNENMPFDQFTIEQIAGDLIPQASTSQKVATGFQRCHLLNGEGGAIAEEQRNIILFDRVDVTATNWLGLTLACAQCHDHKYDPLTQKDFYSMMAFFNQVPESGVPPGGSQYRIADPAIAVGSDEQMKQLAQWDAEIKVIEGEEQALTKAPEFEQSITDATLSMRERKEIAWMPQSPVKMEASNGVTLTLEADQSIFSAGEQAAMADYVLEIPIPQQGLTGIRFELIPDPRLPMGGSGRAASGNAVLSKLIIHHGDQELRVSHSRADYSQGSFSPEAIFDQDPQSGWAFHPDVKTPHWLEIQLAAPVKHSASPLKLTLQFQSSHLVHMFGRFRVMLTDALFPLEEKQFTPAQLALLKKDPAQLSDAERNELRTIMIAADPQGLLASVQSRKIDLKNRRDALANSLPKVMIMSDAQPRKTMIFDRGSYEMPTTEVTSDTPAMLPPMAADLPKNRLGLAKWLMAPENPLTARVQVNRFWQHYFAHGFVKSAENFGLLGDAPTHPELLDWLAVEFRENGWDMKKIHRLIVTSATYRQSSKVTPALLALDPENRLYARATRFRNSSLILRDTALRVSGLLTTDLFGKPVYPYQPPTIWDSLGITKERDFSYPQSQGADLYRRSIYTFWRRTVAPGNMFDTSARRTCLVKHSLTSTPLHALTTLNDITWVEASRVLAEKIIRQSNDRRQWPTLSFQAVCQRAPDATELGILEKSLASSLAEFQRDAAAATQLLSHGAAPRDVTLPVSDHAALTHLCLSIFNLDEALTRQ